MQQRYKDTNSDGKDNIDDDEEDSRLSKNVLHRCNIPAPCFGLLPHLSFPCCRRNQHSSVWFQSSRRDSLWAEPDGSSTTNKENRTDLTDRNDAGTDGKPNRTRRSSLYLIDIIGARGLPDACTVDPFVTVSINSGDDEDDDKDKVVHRTDTIWNEANPIWTIQTNSLCLLRLPMTDSKASNATQEAPATAAAVAAAAAAGSLPTLHEHDVQDRGCVLFQVCRDGPFPRCIGTVRVPFHDLVRAVVAAADKEEPSSGTAAARMQYPLTLVRSSSSGTVAAYVTTTATFAFRVRRATPDDDLPRTSFRRSRIVRHSH
jgi:C2 domain